MKPSKDDLFTRTIINFSPAEQGAKDDAVAYLKLVKDIFHDNKEKYDHFLEILKDFKAQRADIAGVISRVKELFKGHRHLILGFNTFLPKGYEMTLPMEDEPLQRKKKVKTVDALRFISKIKTRFGDHDNVYRDFLDIFHFFIEGDMPTTEVYREVAVLLHGHTDLLEEFKHFLPDNLVGAYVHYIQPGRDHILCHDSGVSPMINARSMTAERNIHHPDSDQRDCIEKEKEKGEDRDGNDWEHDDNMNYTRKSARRDHYVIDQFYQGMQDPVLSFCEKVKEKLQDPKTYKKFSDCLCSYMRKFVTSSEFHMLVASLLGNHADLMKECKDFLNYVEKTGCLEDSKNIVRSLKVEEQDVNDRVRDDTHEVNECDDRGSDRCGRALAFIPRDISGRRMSLCASIEKFMAKPIHELDLSKCESCTPSYRRLPQNCPILSASRRTEIGAKVLNDRWVSVTSGGEDYLFKHMLKNQYEESLFRCEDYRFELDMLLEPVNATIKRVEELLPSINAATSMTDSSFCIEDHLTALNIRCIERLYGDHGLDVMDVLRKNAPLALPVILIRLKQKQEEWARFRSDFNKVWAEICAKDYHKSLDHRSFYFKQQDTKNLSAKALLAEIKEMSEKNQNEGSMLLSIGAGYRQPIRPHMAFEYSDPEIHGDLYQVIKYSSGKLCTPENHDKIITIWTTFLESFLGVPPRPHATDSEYVKDNNHITKSEASLGEGNGCPADEPGSGNCKLDVLKHEDNNIPTEKSLSSGVQMVNDNYGIRNDGFPNADQVAYESDVITQVHTGVLDQGPPYVANADCGTDMMPIIESQDDCSEKPPSLTMGMVRKEVKTNTDQVGELFPNRDLAEHDFSAFENTGTNAAYVSCTSAGSIKITDEKMCSREAGGETDMNAHDQDEESTWGSAYCENASENVDVSASESADSDKHCPEEPDEDRDNDGRDNMSESAGEIDAEALMSFSDNFLQATKPFMVKIPMAFEGEEKNYQIFYGNDSLYLLFRFHQMLYERMHYAKLLSSSPENKERILNDAIPTDPYARFKDALYSLLNGSSDNSKFEDDCRAIIGAQSYILFTLDELIHKLVKQLQAIATEEMENKFLHLYAYERSRNPDKFSDVVYYHNACFLLPDDSLYRIECIPSPTRLTIQLMRNEHDKVEVAAVSIDPNFVTRLNDVFLSAPPERREKPGVFLQRNKRKCTTGDETNDIHRSMEGLIINNGLEIKVNCSTMKVYHVMASEDFMFRTRRRRKALYQKSLCNGSSNGNCHKRKRKLMFS